MAETSALPRVRVKAGSRRVETIRAEVTPVSSGYGRAPSPRIVRSLWGASGPNAAQDFNLSKARSDSRREVAKNGLADAGVDALVSNIVGSGITPQFTTIDADLNKQLAALWLEWTDESDADGRLDFYGQQALAVRSMVEGGDVFGRMRIRQLSDMETVPLQLQVVEAEYCRESFSRPGSAGVNPVRAGVEFDLIGRRVAYHLSREHPFDGVLLGAASNYDPVRVPASEVVHLSVVRRPGQVRGEPWLSRAIAKLNDLDAYDDAQLIRQKIAALFAGFVYEDEAVESGDEGEIFAGQSETYDDGVALAPLEPGTMQKLSRGERVEWSAPPSPGNSYVEFMREQKRGVGLAIGLMYEQISGDFSQVNDRTFRASVNEFRRRCAMWQHNNVVYQFCRPVLRRWTELAVLSGKIVLPAGVTVAQAARAKWVPEGFAYINPVQDVQAKREEVRAGFRSRAEVVSSAGFNVEQVDAEQADDAARVDRLGLVYDTDARKTSGAGGAQALADPEPSDPPAPAPDPQAD